MTMTQKEIVGWFSSAWVCVLTLDFYFYPVQKLTCVCVVKLWFLELKK